MTGFKIMKGRYGSLRFPVVLALILLALAGFPCIQVLAAGPGWVKQEKIGRASCRERV